MDLTVIIILLAGVVISAAMCVMLSNLIKSAIALAATSALLSVVLFALDAPLAAVFELSVCAGLILVIFISAINMTRVRTQEELREQEKERHKRFIYLPLVLFILLCAMVFILRPYIDFSLPIVVASSGRTVQQVLWTERQIDLFEQVIIILAGVYGVIVFFKEGDEK